jgi:GT2 family glycosyltransferase
MYWGDSTRIYQGGGLVHYIGAMVSPRRGEVRTGEVDVPPEPTVGGGIGLYRKSAFQELGAFDEGLEMAPWDDAEAHQRIWLAGKKVLYVDAAHGEHMVKDFDASRHYRARGIIYNRWNYILTQYDWRTIILISPALMLFEAIQLTFYSIKGISKMYFQGTKQVWSLRKTILRKRREVQKSREVSDRKLITSGKIVVSEQTADNSLLVDYSVKILSWLFSKYWIIVRPLIRTRT